jgi:hypothetical protein
MSGRERHVDVARFLDRLAAIQRLRDGQRARLLLNQPGDPEDVLGPFTRRELAPDLVVGLPRRRNGAIHVVCIRLGDLAQLFFGGGVDAREPLLRVRSDELSADEEVVARRDPDVVRRLERGRILPMDRARRRTRLQPLFRGLEFCSHAVRIEN